MPLIILITIMASASFQTPISESPKENFQIAISGPIAKKLAPETQIKMWAPTRPVASSVPHNQTSFAVHDLPRKLDSTIFRNQYWIMEFYDEETLLFSVELSPDLFDKPRKIRVLLERPTPSISPCFGDWFGDIRYTGKITQRMAYREFPYLDKETGTLSKSVSPRLKIIDSAKNSILKEYKMRPGCAGFYWWSPFLNHDPPDGSHFRFVVEYDSGGLFDTVTTKRDFVFQRWMHGRVKQPR